MPIEGTRVATLRCCSEQHLGWTMDHAEFDAWEKRIAQRAEHLWQNAGRPTGSRDRFSEQARELVAIEENPKAGALDPDAAPVIDEASLVANLGEFPSYSDRQGEVPLFPEPQDNEPVSRDTADKRRSAE
jgi:Protein of unknown function (DUF2934)